MTCSVDGCEKPNRRRGLCETHYKRFRRNGDPLIVQPRWHKHHLHGHPLYATWAGMMARCYNDKSAAYAGYGGRGIRVCERWHNIDQFISDVSPRPDGMTLDRRNNDGDYSPENCRWADGKTQSQNSRRNVYITINGVTLCASEWARRNGISPGTVRRRIFDGIDPVKAATMPPLRPTFEDVNAAKRARAKRSNSAKRIEPPKD